MSAPQSSLFASALRLAAMSRTKAERKANGPDAVVIVQPNRTVTQSIARLVGLICGLFFAAWVVKFSLGQTPYIHPSYWHSFWLLIAVQTLVPTPQAWVWSLSYDTWISRGTK